MYSLLTRQLFLHITHEMCFFFTRDWFFLSFNGEMSCVPHYLIIYGTLWLTGFNWKVISNWIWLYLILWSTMRTFLAFYRSSKFRFLGVSSILLKLKRVVRNHLAPSLFSKTANRANSFVNHLQKNCPEVLVGNFSPGCVPFEVPAILLEARILAWPWKLKGLERVQ